MTPESRNNPLPDSGSLTHVSVKMRIHGDRLGTERAFHVNGINKQFPRVRASNKHFPWIRARLWKWECREDWFSRDSFLREFSHSAFVTELSAQLWSVNQRTTEAEEVNQNQVSDAEKKTLVVQQGMERVLGSHGL
jgi:hypothetical protein